MRKLHFCFFSVLIAVLLVRAPLANARSLVIGAVAADPSEEMTELFPLADYLARRLGEFGIEKGAVVVVGSLREMADLFLAGKADLYIDSPYPAWR
jgi:hypothetical protein